MYMEGTTMLVRMMKNRAIKAFAKKLPKFLVVSWGSSDEYSPGQVNKAIAETGCNATYANYAYAMFCSEDQFNEVCNEDYAELKGEIGNLCFGGNSGFNSSDFSVSGDSHSYSDSGYTD